MTYIGIDGGGTTTRVLFKEPGVPRVYFERPVSLKVRNGNFAESAAKLYELLSGLVPIASVMNHRSSVARLKIAMGISGMSREEDQESLKAAILALAEFGKTKIHIESDSTMTLKAVLPEGEEGILLIAGTGSVILYQSAAADQAPRRIGGWGPFLSDDGSGYRIGLRALRRYFWALDGVYPPDPLTERIRARLVKQGIKKDPSKVFDAQDRPAITQLAERDRLFVASLAREALEAASDRESGEAADQIKQMINEELAELITQIFPVFFKGVMSGRSPYKLYLAGSIAKHPIMLETLGKAFEPRDVTPILVDDTAPAMKALEIARGLA